MKVEVDISQAESCHGSNFMTVMLEIYLEPFLLSWNSSKREERNDIEQDKKGTIEEGLYILSVP